MESLKQLFSEYYSYIRGRKGINVSDGLLEVSYVFNALRNMGEWHVEHKGVNASFTYYGDSLDEVVAKAAEKLTDLIDVEKELLKGDGFDE